MSTEKMSHSEFCSRLQSMQGRIEAYANLLITFAVRVELGQQVVLQGPVEAASFMRLLTRQAYEAGASRVHIMWFDDELEAIAFSHETLQEAKVVPAWKCEFYNDLAEQGAAFLTLTGSDPDHLQGIDREKIAAAQKAKVEACHIWRSRLDFGKNSWTIAGVPTKAWAKKVFPGADENEAFLELWQALLDAGRITNTPRESWETHTATLEKNVKFMNRHHFRRLHYTSSNGTDLTVGLAPQGIWGGGPMTRQDGTLFYPNIPTEEVFSSPHAQETTGIVYSALPLAHGGSVVKDFWLRFEKGSVVEYDAAQGKDVLTAILYTDEGARRLGEVALISKNTPIRESGLLFYNTLYDENASCHLALGKGFPECFEDGYNLSSDELAAAGLNMSATHVDFMVGASDLNIVGTTASGEEVQVFENGEWAWE